MDIKRPNHWESSIRASKHCWWKMMVTTWIPDKRPISILILRILKKYKRGLESQSHLLYFSNHLKSTIRPGLLSENSSFGNTLDPLWLHKINNTTNTPIEVY